MDATSSTAPSRDATLADEDGGGHISVAAGMARDAAVLFQARRFGECCDILKLLLQKKENDPKILHNIAITEYYHDGCSDPRKIIEMLQTIKRNCEDLARISKEQSEIATSTSSGVVSGTKGTNTASNQFSASNSNSSSLTYNDEYNISVAALNIAVVYFHLQDYAMAMSILEPLYQNIAPIDETTALHICLLLLDVSLASNDASKAAEVIQYLEKAFGVGYMLSQADNVTMAQHSSSQAVKTSSTLASLPAADAASNPESAAVEPTETQLARTLSDEGLEYEALLSKLDSEGSSIGRQSASSQHNLPEHRGHGLDLKLKLHLYKVRLLLLTRNLKSTKREVKLAMNMARGQDSSTTLLLKSQLEYARGNYRKAIKLLENSSNRKEGGIHSMFSNNFGCIYHQLKKHHTATLFFSKALSSSASLRSEKPLKASTFSQDKSPLILYNCGVQYLACGKPLVAARCFHKAGLILYNRPLLWLRLAECCLLALENGVLKCDGSTLSSVVGLHVVGKGKWRQGIVENASARSRHLGHLQEDGLICEDYVQQRLSLPYARQCLTNALHLLNRLEAKSGSTAEEQIQSAPGPLKGSAHKTVHVGDLKASSNVSGHATANGDSKEPKGAGGSNTTLQSSVSAYEELCRKENHIMKQAVLADLAYVELNLENPLKALTAAKELLQLQDCSKMYIFLAHVYVAEALCLLNRPREAADQLSVYVSGGTNVVLPFSEDDREHWIIEKLGTAADGEETGTSGPAISKEDSSQSIAFLKPEESRGVLEVNLSAICAMLGDTNKAQSYAAQALSVMPDNPIAVLEAVYVDLLNGNTQEALVKLKRCSRLRFYHSDVTTH